MLYGIVERVGSDEPLAFRSEEQLLEFLRANLVRREPERDKGKRC